MAGRKILRKNGSLADLLDKVRACEIDALNEEIFVKSQRNDQSAAVAAVSQRARYGQRTWGQAPGPPSSTQNPIKYQRNDWGPRRIGVPQRLANRRPISQRNRCWRCSSFFHTPENCFAVDKWCRQCQVKGHLERACTNRPGKEGQHAIKAEEMPRTAKVRKISKTTEVSGTGADLTAASEHVVSDSSTD
uniref:CCHC-type domain-containing protein n=1 Tax=Anopheles atroparvus TaxID=41427 RepID=A0A182J5Y5_ANOAO